MVGFGVSVTLFAGSAGGAWVGSTLIMRAISVTTLVAVASLRWRQERRVFIDGIRGMPWAKVCASGVLDVLGNFAFALALARVPLLPVAILSGMYPLATAALAWLLSGERLTSRQRWGGGAAAPALPGRQSLADQQPCQGGCRQRVHAREDRYRKERHTGKSKGEGEVAQHIEDTRGADLRPGHSAN